jgi:hypothetical protein
MSEPEMNYEEALGVGRAISPAQLAMILSMDAWPADRRRDFNIDELLWKQLIVPDPDTISGYALTPRGDAVRIAARLKSLDDKTLLRTFDRTDGESAFAVRVLREIEDRQLDV